LSDECVLKGSEILPDATIVAEPVETVGLLSCRRQCKRTRFRFD